MITRNTFKENKLSYTSKYDFVIIVRKKNEVMFVIVILRYHYTYVRICTYVFTYSQVHTDEVMFVIISFNLMETMGDS